MEFKTLVSWDTEYCADSVEWCPFETFEHVFVCGTYQLVDREGQMTQEGNQSTISPSRHGLLHLMALTQSDEVISRLQTIKMSAVLDCKWAPLLILDQILLAVATANGQLLVYKLIKDEDTSSLNLEHVVLVDLPKHENELDLLTLSINWSVGEDIIRVGTSDSKGRISLFRLNMLDLQLEHSWTAHSFEAWIVNFNPFNPHICYTGGDDCKLRFYDLRCDLSLAKLTNSSHLSGVTSLTCPLKTENLLLSGSYDEQVRLWDIRQMKNSIKNVSLGGGVWRIRFQPYNEDLILVAAMYNGFHLLDQNLHIVAKYADEHKSISYGADWSYLSRNSNQTGFDYFSENNTSMVATCSFYDHKLCVSLVADQHL